MNTLMKGLGAFVLFAGVGTLTIPAFTDVRSNTILGVGAALVVVGFLLHIFLNKKFE